MEMMKTLMEEIERLRSDLAKMDVGSKEYIAAGNRLDSLMSKVIDVEKFDSEQDMRAQELNMDAELKREQMNEDKKSKWIGYGLQALGIGLPLVVTIWGTNKTIKFEQEGTVTTFAGKNFFNNLFRKK